MENSRSVLLINFMLSFIYRPVPPAFVSEFWPMNSYPIFCIPLSVYLVSEIAMTLGISFTVNKILLRRHTFLGKLWVLRLIFFSFHSFLFYSLTMNA